ncbi:unnamed protein product [Zymoseptoria tritici ST99CH_1A5]|uniref:Uncharacterized protein n=1 Tax=Zymoseptoria tritici ST99CH_1A5 TaxID=1276529 RepID=A0A1Y6M1R1_ZYMTR|nr:unnamed protein product [Zymoseptoria tritici ST99CH_1A5]
MATTALTTSHTAALPPWPSTTTTQPTKNETPSTTPPPAHTSLLPAHAFTTNTRPYHYQKQEREHDAKSEKLQAVSSHPVGRTFDTGFSVSSIRASRLRKASNGATSG